MRMKIGLNHKCIHEYVFKNHNQCMPFFNTRPSKIINKNSFSEHIYINLHTQWGHASCAHVRYNILFVPHIRFRHCFFKQTNLS